MNPAAIRHPQSAHAPAYAGSDSAPAPGWRRVEAQTGTAVRLAPGDRLTLLDPCGEQVSDLFLVCADDPRETFSSGRTTDYGNSLFVSTGSALWSNRSRVLAEIVEDTVGTHDLTLTPCSQDTFDILYPDLGGAEHPSCFANLVTALRPYGVRADQIGTTLNVFMNVWSDSIGDLHIDPPPSRPGDRLTIEATRSVIAGITACSAEKSNNGRCTPIDVRVTRAG